MSRSTILFSILLLGLCLAPITGFAQVPDGSILWLDASQLEVGKTLERWDDKSGFGNNAEMLEPLNRPEVIQDGMTRAVKLGGTEYMTLPSVYPTKHDYSIIAVVKIRDTNNTNNILSGDHHAYWFDSRSTPTIAHDDHFFQKGISQVSIRDGYNIIVLGYREETGQAIHHINGLFGDSLWVDSNTDSTLYLGSYQRGYFSTANIAELMLYPRVLSEQDRLSLESTLFAKYQFVPPPPIPRPDSTFSVIPHDLQLYPRGLDDSAVVTIAGKIYRSGFDSIALYHYRDSSELIEYQSHALEYSAGAAPFTFLTKIRAELHDHDFEVHLLGKEFDSIIARPRRVVAGDVYLIGGASNGTFGPWEWTNENPFCRTFGINLSHDPKDTAWAIAKVEHWGGGPSVSGWGAVIQQNIASKYGIPTAMINWGAAGTILIHHLKKPGNVYDLRTFYGKLLYRLDKSGLRNAIKAHFFWHGELNNPPEYPAQFHDLYDSLQHDLPSLEKTYLIQLRPSYCSNLGNMPIREFQRLIQDTLKRIETIASAGMLAWDGCHFTDTGMILVGDQLFRSIERDFYHAADTNFLRSPTLRRAYYLAGKFDEIHLEFEPSNYQIVAQQDTDYLGIHASLKDYFFLDTTCGKVREITTSGNQVVLHLSEPWVASRISYLPDRNYHNTDLIYTGPWLTTTKGAGVLSFHDVPITSKSEVKENAALNLTTFPTPGSGAIHITGRLDTAGPVTIEVIDVNGRTVAQENIFAASTDLYHTMDLTLLARGAYTVRLKTASSTQLAKMLLAP